MCKLDSSYPAKVFKRTRMYPFNKLFACSKKVQFVEHVDQLFGVLLNTWVKKLCWGDDYLGFVIHLGGLIKEYIFTSILMVVFVRGSLAMLLVVSTHEITLWRLWWNVVWGHTGLYCGDCGGIWYEEQTYVSISCLSGPEPHPSAIPSYSQFDKILPWHA